MHNGRTSKFISWNQQIPLQNWGVNPFSLEHHLLLFCDRLIALRRAALASRKFDLLRPRNHSQANVHCLHTPCLIRMTVPLAMSGMKIVQHSCGEGNVQFVSLSGIAKIDGSRRNSSQPLSMEFGSGFGFKLGKVWL